jgi:hypothetical protein
MENHQIIYTWVIFHGYPPVFTRGLLENPPALQPDFPSLRSARGKLPRLMTLVIN